MRRLSLFTRCTRTIVVAFLAITVGQWTALAQPPDEQDSVADAMPEGSTEPDFGGSLHERSHLTGDWWGRRSGLQESGVTFDISTTQFYQGVASGGRQQSFQYGGRDDCFLNLDGEKLCFWKGTSVTLHGENRYGESVNTLAGTILAPNLMLSLPQLIGSVSALSGVTFTQDLCDELQIFGGKINTIDGYQQPLTGAGNLTGFQNTAMLYNPVFSRTVPYSTFGAGFTYLWSEDTEFSATVYDTNNTPTVSGFDTFFNNGVTVYMELNVSTTYFGRPGHHGISGTYSSGKYSSLTPSAFLDPIEGFVIVPASKTGSWCLVSNFDQALYVSPEDPQRMWGVFGNFGIADNNPSPVRWFASVGISGASQFAGRNADTFGMAYFYLGVSEPLKTLAPTLLSLRDEHGVELYYNMAVTPWCHITPDLQVITPFRERADTSLIVGLRAKIDF